jgi:roadblock/LC7 domain-containing protein
MARVRVIAALKARHTAEMRAIAVKPVSAAEMMIGKTSSGTTSFACPQYTPQNDVHGDIKMLEFIAEDIL